MGGTGAVGKQILKILPLFRTLATVHTVRFRAFIQENSLVPDSH
jgi:hypothetical protein